MSDALLTTLQKNGVAVIATDTLYGIVGSAHAEAVVQRIYDIKGRDEGKPFIILIPLIETLKDFGVVLSTNDKIFLESVWPGAVTVILPVIHDERTRLAYLHRNTNELAFRLPAKPSLQTVLSVTGPLVAPSANPQGLPPARTIDEAQAYFGTTVDHYEDEGTVEGEPSTIIRLSEGKIELIRQGSTSIPSRQSQ